MAFHGRASSKTHHMDDLDTRPIREVRGHVLNDVRHDPVVSPPRVKFHYVDVSFPKAPDNSAKPENVEMIEKSLKRKKNDSDRERKESRGLKSREHCDKENEFFRTFQSQPRSMDADRREFLNRLLKKGVPVWEEVPEEERRTKIIGE